MTSEDKIHDVVQIGYGPVGQTHAALLGKMGHDVAVFERHAGLYALPRAGHVDHEIMRIFQSIGCVEAIQKDIFRCSTYGWRNAAGETLLDIDWSQDGISGWASDYLFYQPYLEDALDVAVSRLPSVEVHHGWEAIGFDQHADHVEVTLARGALDDKGVFQLSDERRRVRGRYLVGADGANSFVRNSAGMAFEDLGFREQWLVTDFRQKRPLSFEFDNGQICDPARPLCLFQLGKSHRRFEFMILPGEDGQELTQTDRVWSLVKPWLKPEDAELIRSTVYTFRSANALQWRSGRVMLIGDAAHLMPPFLGQGMCSGIRDAAGLSWKLDLVLRELADGHLLDSHMLERRPHVGSIIEQAVALGKVSCTIDLEEASVRDQAFLSGAVPPPPPFPWLVEGILQSSPSGAAAGLVGRLGPQALVGWDGRTGLADDVMGSGWQLLSAASLVDELNASSHDTLALLSVSVGDFGDAGDHSLEDAAGSYGRFFAEAGVRAILVRPDFYVFGAIGPGEDANDLIADLAKQLRLQPGMLKK